MRTLALAALALLLIAAPAGTAAQKLNVIAYYAGNATDADKFEAEKLTHIIFSFCHLRGNRLHVDDAGDTLTIKALVSLKQKNPSLKVLLSLGGWGGCETCSDVFSDADNRKIFAASVKQLCDYFNTDGIDLDWEYPTIPGYPGHSYSAADKNNFTELVKQLRATLGKKREISFAAGGFPRFLQEAVDWKTVMRYCDRVNLMTYDLVHGYDTVTGHHTALYSTPQQLYSTDHAVQYLVNLGIARNKLVIGAAFYARVWENVPAANNGLYQPGRFKTSVGFRNFATTFSKENGFVLHRDSIAQAPWFYSAEKKLFATFDDMESIRRKTRYAVEQRLNGIMFWELRQDLYSNGLLNVINNNKQ